MQDMIKRIVEADNQARALDEANKKAAEKEKQRIEKQAAAIYQQYMDEAQEEIARNDAYLDKKKKKKMADITAHQESALIKLKADYDQNRDRWVDEIVDRVLG